ncbi:MAG: hypothetical protein A2946_00695 [Candidatus Liptonbacteria bacterium RIFCSPLOWO2_01_FULL_53_13]|uniref:Enolase n=1 Tax=Candidatus Liptonbacteria bacterium RIFCSPLOWO2_01_FULL_53_13 TaxID=1798651 RepID=A0A1G2CP12_9BACT|nr:MAG: hypothetical protein A2946_00695 [Candidatus Liptonbacteria bacterium RIFCSPLOWO2_01_FULL_53_13]
MKLNNIVVREIFDSRGKPTISVCVEAASGVSACAEIPSGKSRGSREAAVLRPKEAVVAVKKLLPALKEKDFSGIAALDRFLISEDGTPNKSKLGGNTMLGISVAFARILAETRKEELWQTVQREFFPEYLRKRPRVPYIFSNLINGGAHADNNLDIQEYMVVVAPKQPIEKSVEKLIALYKKLGKMLALAVGSPKALRTGDEGGYSLNFQSGFEPLRILNAATRSLRAGKMFSLAIDAAASEFYRHEYYVLEGKGISREALVHVYLDFLKRIPALVSLEDPFDEEDREGFKSLLGRTKGKLIVGDDLTTTNPKEIKRCAEEKLINAVIIKPNQIGTVSEACEAMKVAEKFKLKTIVSHRSGETEDSFIIHLARAGSAYGVKIGAPVRERMSKFNELIRLYS